MRKSGFLYLPMEIAVRELDSRLLIALEAVNRGLEVVLGQKWLIEENVAAMPPGLIIFKTLTARDSRKMRKASRAGHLIASIDEEVPAFGEGSGELLWVTPEAVALCDRIFCLGDGHRDSMAAKWPDQAPKLAVTGNPRWDFLRPELRSLYQEQAAKLTARFGRFILINTNSGNVNPATKKPEEVFNDYVRSGKLDPASARDMAFWNDYWQFETANFKAAAPLARRLAQAFPDHTIILRPHPSERLSAYADQLAGEDRIKVIFEGSAAPWIVASDLLIHTDCTTGIEAFALGKPSICFETVPSILHEQLLSGRLSFTVTREDDVLDTCHRILAAKPGEAIYPPAMEAIFHRFFAAQEGPLAAARVVDEAMRMLGVSGAEGLGLTQPAWQPSWTYRRRWISEASRRRKFPPMDLDAVRTRLQELAQLLGMEDVPSFAVCGDNLIHLYRSRLRAPKPAGSMFSRALDRMMGTRAARVALTRQ